MYRAQFNDILCSLATAGEPDRANDLFGQGIAGAEDRVSLTALMHNLPDRELIDWHKHKPVLTERLVDFGLMNAHDAPIEELRRIVESL